MSGSSREAAGTREPGVSSSLGLRVEGVRALGLQDLRKVLGLLGLMVQGFKPS